jgi:hypothetical protein
MIVGSERRAVLLFEFYHMDLVLPLTILSKTNPLTWHEISLVWTAHVNFNFLFPNAM